jgi:hypothetical protein
VFDRKDRANVFTQLPHHLSVSFIAPFFILFISPTSAGGINIFDVNLLIAIAAYSLLGYLGVSLVRFVFYREA